MKKITKIFFASVLSVGFGIAAQAQDANAIMTASAKVYDEISVGVVTSLNFGQVMTNTTKTITPLDLITSSGSGVVSNLGATRGVFRVLAGVGAKVELSFALPSNLVGAGAGGNMPIAFGPEMAAYNTTNVTTAPEASWDPSTVKEVTMPTATITYDPGTGDVSANGIYVFIGGAVNASGKASDTYTGNITLTAAYN